MKPEAAPRSTKHDVQADGLDRWLPDVLAGLLATERAVPAFEILREREAHEELSLQDLRRLFAALREQGYLRRALVLGEIIDRRASEDAPPTGALVAAELAVLGGELALEPPRPERPYAGVRGRALVVASSSVLDAESSSTSRTHALARSGRAVGLEIFVATQMGVAGRSSYDVDERDGVRYQRIPGPARGSRAFDEWMRLFTIRLAAVVRKLQPAVLVASSDFVNGSAAHAVGRAYGIPVVYDVRGLWEESWLKRQRAKHGWSEAQVPNAWGMPDVWSLRRERELELASVVDAVVVPSTALRDALVDLGAAADRITIAADDDADAWAAVLESVGAVEQGSAALARLSLSSEQAIKALRTAERKQLGTIETFAGSGTVQSVRDVGWRHAGLEPVLITVPFDWIEACRDHRSQAFHLHAWDFMVPFLRAWERDRDREALDWCLQRAADWARTFNDGEDRGTMAWYDMAIGLRAPRLAYLLQEAVREAAGEDIIAALASAVVRHQRALFAPQAFNAANNHGFYTAVGQLSFARRLAVLPGMDIVEAQGRDRLRTVVATQFAEDGGHLEHSPDYHRMLLSSFIGAMQDGLLTDPEVAERIERASEVMGWFLRPDRSVVQIGDSPARVAQRSDREMAAPHTAFLVREGAVGEPNPQELLLLEQSGYAFVRSPQPVGRDDHRSAGYLTLMAGFHSRTHKHCDDLSITWFDAGEELLIDAGRFGYLDQLPADSPLRDQGFFYGRPERQYVERTRAHNTVEADGRDHERRHRAPYGSGIRSGEQEGSKFRLVGFVDHGVWSHRRSITYLPGSWLLIDDEVTSQDGQPHDFQVWWNLPESLTDPRSTDGQVTFTLSNGRALHISALHKAELVAPVKGQEEPMRGWRSMVDYEFTPAWSMGHRVSDRMSHHFKTLLSIDGVPAPQDIGSDSGENTSRTSVPCGR